MASNGHSLLVRPVPRRIVGVSVGDVDSVSSGIRHVDVPRNVVSGRVRVIAQGDGGGQTSDSPVVDRDAVWVLHLTFGDHQHAFFTSAVCGVLRESTERLRWCS